jgi:hypothetical protein
MSLTYCVLVRLRPAYSGAPKRKKYEMLFTAV